MDVVAPEFLETHRLMLRRAQRGDAAAIFEYASDPETTRLMNWRTLTHISEAESSIETREKGWASGTEFNWIVTTKSDNRPIGAVGCFPDGHRAEIGYILNRRYWGNGYATEAARRAMEWLFDDVMVWRVWATCDVDNLASVRVLEKIGMTLEGRLRRLVIRPNLGPEPRDSFIYARVRE